ncbi:MAG TPA: enoyl-CoA hydratase/isomerase family protein, partial [Marmoricola sp.]
MANPGTELTFLSVERPSDGVVVLRLNDPDRRNVMSDDMTESWGRALTEIKADPSVRVVVVTGAGTAFSSGGNTGWIASEPDATVDYLRTRMIAF